MIHLRFQGLNDLVIFVQGRSGGKHRFQCLSYRTGHSYLARPVAYKLLINLHAVLAGDIQNNIPPPMPGNDTRVAGNQVKGHSHTAPGSPQRGRPNPCRGKSVYGALAENQGRESQECDDADNIGNGG